MRRIAQVGVVATMLFSGAVCMGSEEAVGILPSGFGQEVDRAVEQLRKITAPFHSIDRALAAGYKQETECVERPPDGGMGYHFGAARPGTYMDAPLWSSDLDERERSSDIYPAS